MVRSEQIGNIHPNPINGFYEIAKDILAGAGRRFMAGTSNQTVCLTGVHSVCAALPGSPKAYALLSSRACTEYPF